MPFESQNAVEMEMAMADAGGGAGFGDEVSGEGCLRPISNLRATAISATILSLPAAMRRS